MLDPASAPLLRRARAKAGLSQRALATRAHTAQSVVARIELGITIPSLDTLRRLVGAAGFDLDVRLEHRVVFDPAMLDDVPRILALSPEDRLREVGTVNRFVGAARRV
jgi:transcriptional regulator with XRE-family HTH domain